MIDMLISVNGAEIEEKLGDLAHKAELVMRRSSNAAIGTATKNIKQETAKRYNITSTAVWNTIKTYKASGSLPFASVVTKGTHIDLGKFKVTPFRPAKRKKRGGYSPETYKAEVKKHGGKKYLGGSPKPFVATIHNRHKDHIGVFRRKTDAERKNQKRFRSKYKRRDGTSRQDNTIVALYGPAIPQMVKNEEIMLIVNREVKEKIMKNAEHEISRLIN